MPNGTDATLAKYSLYSWQRNGLANNISGTSPSGRGQIRADINISINNNKDNNINVPKEFELIGPPDIIGFDVQQIIKVEPQEGNTNFGPNFLSFIEFYDEDLPWRYSPLANSDPNFRPWIFLITLKDSEFSELQRGQYFSIIQIKDEIAASVKSFREGELKYWAHVQVTDQAYTANNTPPVPDRITSRIICPRKLEPNTPYTSFLLPAFDKGVEAGGGVVGENKYPVYYQWRFHTNNAVDFEYLTSLLEPRTLDYWVGRRLVDFSNPGFIKNNAGQEITYQNLNLVFEGPLISDPDAPRNDTPISESELGEFRRKLKEYTTQSTVSVDLDKDPIVSIPFYGAKHVIENSSELEGEDGSIKNEWLHQLNWDKPGNRAAAGLGVKIIRKFQDDYMKRAWDQLETIVEANKTINLAEVVIEIVRRWENQHLKPLQTDAVASYVQVMAPIIKTDAALYNQLMNSCQSTAVYSGAFRRQTAPGSIISRTLRKSTSITPEEQSNTSLEKVINDAIEFVKRGIDNIPIFEHLLSQLEQFFPVLRCLNLNDDDLGSAGYSQTHLAAAKNWMCSTTSIPDNPNQKNCADFTEEALFNYCFSGQVYSLLNLMYDLPSKYKEINPCNVEVRDKLRLRPVMAYPHFDEPMFTQLREMGTDLLIANLDKVPNNTISILQSNRDFIESFMVGLNYEMGKELRWREYPTDERGSYFRQFWDVSGIADYDGQEADKTCEEYKDITPLHTWEDIPDIKNDLGSHSNYKNREELVGNKAIEGTGNLVVLIIRGELIKAFPNITVYAVPALEANEDELFIQIGEKKLKMNPREDTWLYPIFKADIAPDIKFLGFPFTKGEAEKGGPQNLGYFFVMKEVPGELRLGLDISKERELKSWEDLSWPDLEEKSLLNKFGLIKVEEGRGKFYFPSEPEWGDTSANMAFVFYQKPVIMAVHATQMLPQNQ